MDRIPKGILRKDITVPCILGVLKNVGSIGLPTVALIVSKISTIKMIVFKRKFCQEILDICPFQSLSTVVQLGFDSEFLSCMLYADVFPKVSGMM